MVSERQIRVALRQPGLDGVVALCRESLRIEKALHEAVASARGKGYSWKAIGEAMGITKQAAWRRFTRNPITRH